MLYPIEAYKLNWNPITVEGFNENKNEITMIFNCDISTEAKSNEVIMYVVGRTLWCCQNFPSKAKVTLSFDIRGQGIIMAKSTIFKEKMISIFGALVSENQILIDFIR